MFMKKTALLLAVATGILFSQGANAALISYYNFNEGSGSTFADSVRGAGGNGSLYGTYAWGTGSNAISGSSIRFFGPQGGADIVSGALTTMVSGVTTGYTLSAWAKFNSYTSWGSVVKNWGTGSSGGIHLGLDDNNPYFSSYIRTGGVQTGVVASSAPLTLGQWHHILFTYDGSLQKLYLNGAFQGSAAATGNLDISNPNLAFGAKKSDSGSDFNSQIDGWIDEVAIYNVALAAGDVSTLYTNGTNGIGAGGGGSAAVPEPGQVAASLLLLGGIGGYVFIKRRKAAKPAVAPIAA